MNAAITCLANAINAREWHSLLGQADYHAYQQDWAYGEVLRSYGSTVNRVSIMHDDQVIGLAQIQTRKVMRSLNLSLCLRGPVWLNTGHSEAVRIAAYRALRKMPLGSWPHIALWMPEHDSYRLLRRAGLKRVISGYSTVMLDLRQPVEHLRAALDSKWRNRLHKAEASDLAICRESTKPGQYDWLIEQELIQRHVIGYQALAPQLVERYQAAASSPVLWCLSARHRTERIAGILCLLHGRHATYHIGWSSPLGKEMNAHNLLLWEMMVQLKQRGIEWLDLGGVNTQDGAGIARFKIGTGGSVLTLSGTYL